MAADNHTTIVGNLVDDPELRFTNNGIAVTNLRVAVTSAFSRTASGATATPASSRSTSGGARPSTWPTPSPRRPGDGHRAAAAAQLGDPQGDKRSVTEIEADEVGASLKWATAKVERSSQRDNGERSTGRERQAERGGDFNDQPPF
jgi:single-strand DNA-binding protein